MNINRSPRKSDFSLVVGNALRSFGEQNLVFSLFANDKEQNRRSDQTVVLDCLELR